MKKFRINPFKKTIQFLLLISLFTTACGQSEKSEASINKTKKKQSIAKSGVDIFTAVISGNLEAVNQHIEAGTNLNQKEPMGGSTPLITAITFNKTDIAKSLIDAKADLSIKNNDGSTALHSAAFFGRIEIVQMLIDAKANKSILNNFGATPRQTVTGDFSEIKPFYEMITLQLKPMGFTLDIDELIKARPVIAMMLAD